MSDSFQRELEQFQQQAAAVQRTMREIEESVPPEAEGADARGAVRVTLGADGLPARFQVATDWQRRSAGAAFGSAVVEACGAAMEQRMAAWSLAMEQAARRGLFDDAPGANGAAGSGAGAGAGPQPPAAERDVGHVIPRPIDEVTEDMLSALDAAQAAADSPTSGEPVTGTGSGARGRVTVTVQQGALVSCEVDGSWAAGESSVSLGSALDAALAEARGRLAAALAEAESAAGPKVVLDGLYDEAMAILKNPERYGNP
ncbi:hypothetical protein AB0D04_01180 [Streptomyces sp. NPDC048483]|uniref:hypothetical protein n=1 Tax=Streptomyces sp. NPDC048483 TaxID=3154927 RepID=UPI0034271530